MSVVEQLATSAVMPYLAALADCLCVELTANGAGPLCWCGLLPGFQVSLDYCDTCSGDNPCGMAWVRVISVTPTESFPIASLNPNCQYPLVWQVEAGAVRCMPIPADGETVSVADAAEATLNQMADLEAIHRALLCCDAPQMVVERYTPIGPDGGCVGGFWTAYLGL